MPMIPEEMQYLNGDEKRQMRRSFVAARIPVRRSLVPARIPEEMEYLQGDEKRKMRQPLVATRIPVLRPLVPAKIPVLLDTHL